jgi:branched-chain amino acid aminotransferase
VAFVLLLVMEFINVNGKSLTRDKAFITPDNHSYRYGDGIFETIKVKNGKLLLGHLHFDRFFRGLSALKMIIPKLFTAQNLEKEIIDLCRKNKCGRLARVRLSVSRGAGGLYDVDENFQWIIECWPLNNEVNKLNENGFILDVFPDGKKNCDAFANLKSASHLPYVMAALFAKENKLDDCLLLNSYGRICDSTIANLFWIKNGNVFTPPLSEGCIDGVRRRYLIQSLQGTGHMVRETVCELNDLEDADEIFLTNAIREIRWVKQFRSKAYANPVARNIFEDYVQKLIE